ncbi:MAG: flagellar motor switch protein FliM, partial [Proteobacteria bacterium]
MMDAPATPAETRSPILERLIGATGEPSQVKAAARSVGERAVPAIMQALAEKFAIDVTVELQGVELVRYTDARPTVTNHAMSVTPSAISPDALALTIDAEAAAPILTLLFAGDPRPRGAPRGAWLSPLGGVVATQAFDEIS